MAIPLRTFGNTLTDLQAGTNAAQGLDYSRANAQDAINQARLEAFLRLRGQQATIQAQQNSLAQERAMRMAELAQQNQQFGTSETNRMALGKLASETQLGVAKEKGFEPRFLQTAAEIDALNQENKQRYDYLTQLSETRKKVVKEMADMKKSQGLTDFGDPNSGRWDRSVSPEWTKRVQMLNQIDTQVAAMVDPRTGLRVVVDPVTGGLIVPPLSQTHLVMPGQTPPPPNAGVSTPSAQPPVPAMLQGGVGASGLPADWGTVSGSPFDRLINGPVAPPVDASAPSTVAPPPNRTIRVNPDGSLFYVQ